MLDKTTVFLDKNITRTDLVTFKKANELASALCALAREVSFDPQTRIYQMVRGRFKQVLGSGLYAPNSYLSDCFLDASVLAHRMEISLRIDEEYGNQAMEHVPLTLTIKFYKKNTRKDFLDWGLTIGSMGGEQDVLKVTIRGNDLNGRDALAVE